MVTTLSPAVPQDPYKIYVVGALKPDDFGVLKLRSPQMALRVSRFNCLYKDTDGNQYNSVQDVKISAPATNSQSSFPSNLLFPIIAVVIVVGACIVGWYFYVRRNNK